MNGEFHSDEEEGESLLESNGNQGHIRQADNVGGANPNLAGADFADVPDRLYTSAAEVEVALPKKVHGHSHQAVRHHEPLQG